MKSLLLLIGCATLIFALGALLIFLSSYALGKPLSKGCGKTDCCRKTNCDQNKKHSYQKDEHFE